MELQLQPSEGEPGRTGHRRAHGQRHHHRQDRQRQDGYCENQGSQGQLNYIFSPYPLRIRAVLYKRTEPEKQTVFPVLWNEGFGPMRMALNENEWNEFSCISQAAAAVGSIGANSDFAGIRQTDQEASQMRTEEMRINTRIFRTSPPQPMLRQPRECCGCTGCLRTSCPENTFRAKLAVANFDVVSLA